MNEEQKRIKAIIDEQIRLLAENPKLKGKTDAQLWRAEQVSRSTKANHANPEWKAEWDEKQKLAGQKRAADLNWQAAFVAGREKNKLANQKRCNKQVSCDGVIYESGKAAAIALAPETYKADQSKAVWLKRQMKKFPNRYFYITKSE